MNDRKYKGTIAIMLENLPLGGLEKTCLNLATGLQKRGVRVDLVLRCLEGEMISEIPANINVVNFSKSRMITTMFPLMGYLRKEKPAVLISNYYPISIVAVLSQILAKANNTKLIIVQHNTLSQLIPGMSYKQKFMVHLMRWLYPKAELIVGVSEGVSRDLEECLGLKKESLKTIHNGIIDEDFFKRVNEPLDHEWFNKGNPPVLIAIGRFDASKDFSNLLKSFALLRKKRSVRLMILGDGRLRPKLEELVEELGLKEDVRMPGSVNNPLKYLKRCSSFILSSYTEGLSTVLVEALACGCRIVATDCPSGSAEILEQGKYGILVPVRNPQAMAEAMGKALDSPPDPASLIERAKQFSVENAVSKYLSIIKSI